LTITKNEIYKFSEENNILFLFDSTPSWSQRGKIRDIVRPSLEIWNNNMIGGLIELTDLLRESFECVDLLIDNMKNKLTDYNYYSLKFGEEIKYLELEIDELKINKILWNRFFNKIGMKLSIKSLEEVLRRFENIKEKDAKREKVPDSYMKHWENADKNIKERYNGNGNSIIK
jgi:tRNA(Ile)-lysidine synthase TilS/MesJ